MSLGVSVPSFSVSEHHYHHWCVLVVAVKLTGVRANRGYFGANMEQNLVNAQWWTKKKES